MGKITGFLEIDRVDKSYKPVEERLKNFNEFTQDLEKKVISDQGARCMDCGIPYCHTGCPVNNIIPDWNDLVYNNKWEEAIEVLHSTNNFPEFTGRICPAPCEAACTLNIDDNPVTIKNIECAIAIFDKDGKDGEDTIVRYLEFSLGEEFYAVPLLKVREVLAMPETTPVPFTPKHFLGIMNLRGQVISVIDLRDKMGIQKSDKPGVNADDETAVIIVDLNPIFLGVVVDSVNNVLTVDTNHVNETPQIESQKNTDWNRRFEELEKIYPLSSSLYSEDEEFRESALQINKKLNESDKETIQQWSVIRQVSIKSITQVLEILGHKFDLILGESDVNYLIPEMLESLLEKKKITEDGGAYVVSLNTDPKI